LPIGRPLHRFDGLCLVVVSGFCTAFLCFHHEGQVPGHAANRNGRQNKRGAGPSGKEQAQKDQQTNGPSTSRQRQEGHSGDSAEDGEVPALAIRPFSEPSPALGQAGIRGMSSDRFARQSSSSTRPAAVFERRHVLGWSFRVATVTTNPTGPPFGGTLPLQREIGRAS